MVLVLTSCTGLLVNLVTLMAPLPVWRCTQNRGQGCGMIIYVQKTDIMYARQKKVGTHTI